MKNISLDLLAVDVTDDAALDAMLEKLEQMEPPVDMVSRVLNAVSQLPLTYGAPVALVPSWHELEVVALAE
ncbi:hypothetical protein [Dictyobacter arantiisoli]|uniref:Uncharacterized protein n=1 Tax=Dictyobacter arantiisoli TaxID=2014874 RepID=A0A5A5T768_9CHLR|nr:hypothetical protein [Dictyobacter arantiisoli]GCF06843.1 hypothetical protein KDI_04070 [Dictyobacter arantiisoli]